MADDTPAGGNPAVATLEAQLAAARAELDNAKARITDLNNEAKGHRLNSDKYRTEAEKAAKDRDEAIAENGRKLTEAEAAHAEKVRAAETKATEATSAAQQKAIRADIKVAAKEAGAVDVGDVLALIDMSKVKVDESGDVTNAAELLTEMKKAKPHLFGTASTSSTATPPPKKDNAPKSAKDMSDEEFEAAMRTRAWRA